MSSQPTVSVVITTYNRAAQVRDAIRSVLAQSYDSFEIWVVDDGSQDGTEALLQPLLSEKVHYVRQKNGGVSAARNTGIKHSRGRYIALLDDDDLCLPDRLATETAFMERHPEVGVVFSDLWKIYPDGCRSRFTETVPRFWAMLSSKDLAADHVIPAKEFLQSILLELPLKPSTVMMRRSCFDKVGLFSEQLGPNEMLELILRLVRAGETFGYIHTPLIDYHVWHGNIGAASGIKAPLLAVRILRENRRLAQLDRTENRWARQGIAIQYYTLGSFLLEGGKRLAASRAYFSAFRFDRNPLYLGLAISSLLPRFFQDAARQLRRRLPASVARNPWHTEITDRRHSE
jgi:glycosyltransferase involved in cell wall biosynthesis